MPMLLIIWYNELEMKLVHIISAISITIPFAIANSCE